MSKVITDAARALIGVEQSPVTIEVDKSALNKFARAVKSPEQPNPLYFDEEYADGHTRATYLKLAALLHDVAKPETKAVQPDGRVRFLGHPVKGAATSEKILKRLRASSKATEAIRVMVDQHLRPSQLAQKGEMPTSRAVYRYSRDVGDVAVDTLYLCMADYLAARGPDLDLEDWARHCDRMRFTLQDKRVQEAPERR